MTRVQVQAGVLNEAIKRLKTPEEIAEILSSILLLVFYR